MSGLPVTRQRTPYTAAMSSVMTLWIAVGALAFGQRFGPTPSAPVISAELWPLSPAGDAEDCSKPELLANGYPVMASIRKGLSFGISLGQHAFREGDPIELHIWVDNTSGAPAGVFTCWDLAHFMTTGFEILREDGTRVLSRNETKARDKCSTDPKAAASWGSGHARGIYKYPSLPTRVSLTTIVTSKLNSPIVMSCRLVNMQYGCGGLGIEELIYAVKKAEVDSAHAAAI
jgi:hypothetical protein